MVQRHHKSVALSSKGNLTQWCKMSDVNDILPPLLQPPEKEAKHFLFRLMHWRPWAGSKSLVSV